LGNPILQNVMNEIILLHGALGDSQQLKPLEDLLADDHIVHRLNFSGHGGTPFADLPFSIENFAREVLVYLEEQHISSLSIFGYSMGGYVALYLAKHYPHKIKKLITVATKFHWDNAGAAKETALLNSEKIEEKLPVFADSLKKRHHPQDWKMVLQKTADMLSSMGNKNPLAPEDYLSIENPTLLMLGDRDKMVSLAETLAVYQALPHAQLSILPGTAHPIEVISAERLAYEIRTFFRSAI
jgi:pimeloyl-ACP methyl ester carboxylesterase